MYEEKDIVHERVDWMEGGFMSTGRIPDSIIDQVLNQHDIVETVGKYVQLSKQGHYLKGLCPFHSEKSPSFTVTPEKQIYHCFGCGVGGNVIHFIMEIEGYSFTEAVRRLADEAGISYSWQGVTNEQTVQQQEKSTLLEAYELTNKLYQYILHHTEQGKVAKSYLANRGITDKLCETFQIGYAPSMWDTLVKQLDKRNFAMPLMERGGLISKKSDQSGYVDKFRERIIFPIFDTTSKVIAFGGRALGDQQPKYLNSPETILFNKSKVLYNMHQARPHIRKSQDAVLFEGYVDVIKAWEAGVINGVATMGTALTADHVSTIKRNAEKITVCYDGDSAGQNAAHQSISVLEEAGLRVKIAMIPDKQDPDEYITQYGHQRFRQDIIEAAVTSMKYRLLYIRKNFRLQDDADRMRYVQTAMAMIAGCASPLEREHYLKQVSSEFPELSYESMKQSLHEFMLEFEKKRDKRDNNQIQWNNVRNNRTAVERSPALFPAYHNAERFLLSLMIHSREVSLRVEQELADQFHVEEHAVLAAYLYAYYGQHEQSNPSRYIAMLQDERLESLASSIAMIGQEHGSKERVIDDYIREIKKVPMIQEISLKKSEMIHAERSGNMLQAAQIAKEINNLEKKLKSPM